MAKLKIEEKLSIQLHEEEQWNLKFIERIDELPDHIVIEAPINYVQRLLKFIHKVKRDLKQLTVKVLPQFSANIDYIEKIYKAIGAFKELQMLNISEFENYEEQYRNLARIIQSNNQLRSIQVCDGFQQSSSFYVGDLNKIMRIQKHFQMYQLLMKVAMEKQYPCIIQFITQEQ
ncbi:hypothetical protein FGO68_gene13855 [Halteria grandinella]|uniref:Uncharacterized protein n=1 Tax=Halteria grandinella TaxID=5974 RepID=A0A8J8T8W1_HALGN|nr:hypothetical protein FGO68_gene13855 [Halteria grandinella]